MSLLRFSNSALGVRTARRCFSSSVASRAKLQIFNPATEELVKEVEADTPQTVKAKFAAAKEAQKNWAAVPLPYKLRIVETFCNLLTTHHETLAQTLTSEMGKPINQAKAEVSATVGRCQFFIKHTPSVLEEKIVNEGKGMKEKITREPLGVVGNISAWNYPYFVGTNVLIPALLTGNSVLYKPSEHSTLTGQAIISLLHQAGVPKDALACVVGKGDIGTALLEQPINGIYFTGSLATGKKIASKVGGTFMRIQLELGGKDPTYVCDDAKVDVAAASLADGAMYNTGQSCCSVERIYVHKNIYNAFVDKFVSEVKSFKIGAPTESSTYIGPLTRKEQVGILKDHVSDAVKQGAKLLVGGSPTSVNGKGYYFEPTVLVNVTHNMKVMREESFGPIIGIQKVESDEEAVKLMNDTDYGLTSGVYSTNEQRASVILSRINSGTVYWNCCDRVSPALPWSGRKGSGVGSTLGTDGILAFVQPKAWHLKSA